MMFSKLRNYLFKSEFSRNVITLMSGVFVSQLILFLVSPILSRLYTPAEFGDFALFNSIIGILVILSTARFEYAIALPKSNIDGFRIIKIILILSLFISLISYIIAICVKKKLGVWFDTPKINNFLFIIPSVLVMVVAFQSLTFWFNRLKKYKLQAMGKLASSIGQSSASLLLGIIKIGSLGLILGYILGQFLGVILMTLNIKKDMLKIISDNDFLKLKTLAKRYSKFPTFMTLGGLINTVATQLHIFMITGYFNATIVGAISFAQTTIVLPTSLISRSFSDVFRIRAIEDFQAKGNCRPLLLRTLKKLFLIGIIPFSAIFYFAPIFFELVFGKEWILAGEFAQIMTLMFFVRFVFMSISSTVIIITEKLEYDILWQTGFLISVFFSIFLGNYFFKNIKVILILFTIINSIFYIILFLIAYKCAFKK